MAAVRIVVACVLLACLYGVAHDQVTARMSIEYFTLAHPDLGLGTSPTVLALAWGVRASWWMGLGIGLVLALAARAGSWPKLDLRDLRLPMLVFVGLLFVLAMMALTAGWAAGVSDKFHVHPRWADQMPYERHKHFLAAAWAHRASYWIGGFGTLLLAAHVVLLRWRRARGLHAAQPSPR
jgi:hypothetical protein